VQTYGRTKRRKREAEDGVASTPWGVFTLVPIRRKYVHIGWQMTCAHPKHPGTEKTPFCTRSMNFKGEAGTSGAAHDEDFVLRCLKWWALQGFERSSKRGHQRLPRHPVSLPSMAELESQLPTVWPWSETDILAFF